MFIHCHSDLRFHKGHPTRSTSPPFPCQSKLVVVDGIYTELIATTVRPRAFSRGLRKPRVKHKLTRPAGEISTGVKGTNPLIPTCE